jgi:hypothetical protein
MPLLARNQNNNVKKELPDSSVEYHTVNIETNEADEFMSMDGYDDCIVGVVEQFGKPPILCYDKLLMIQKMVGAGSSYEDAEEYFEYNQIGAYVGESTPCFLTPIPLEDLVSLDILK